MKQYRLHFYGYTWDDYFYVIADKPGILIIYRGGLDIEGLVQLYEVLYIGEADQLRVVNEEIDFGAIKKSLPDGDRLFFSYAEMNKQGRKEVVNTLIDSINPKYSPLTKGDRCIVSCYGACALFPKELLFPL